MNKKKTDGLTRLLNIGSGFVSACAGLLATVLILYSGYVLYDSLAIEVSAFSSNSDLLKYKPSVMAEAPDKASLADINPDYRGWITVDNNPIDYPVVQGEDDLYYASHDANREISLTGAIYLAAENSPDFSDSYNLLYGHHMDSGAMFGSLDKFRDETYFNEHREAKLITKDGKTCDVTFFAVVNTDAYERQIYSVGNRAAGVLSFLTGSRENDTGLGTKVLIYDKGIAEGAKKILALSTCASADTNGRLVVFGRIKEATDKPTDKPTDEPTDEPTDGPTDGPTEAPSTKVPPTVTPTETSTTVTPGTPTPTPTKTPSGEGSKATATPAPKTVRLTVKFREGDREVFPDQVIIYQAGDSYYVVAPQYPGYEMDVQILRGTIEKDMTVTVNYRPKEWDMKIRYIFQDGGVAAPSYQEKLLTGEKYDVESPEIEGYKTRILRIEGTNPGRNEQFTVIYIPEYEKLGDEPTPLGLEQTFMQVGVCFE